MCVTDVADSEQEMVETVMVPEQPAAPPQQVSTYYESERTQPTLSNGTVHQEEPMAVEPAMVKPAPLPEEPPKVSIGNPLTT